MEKGNAARTRRYRKQHRRIDYVPNAEAMKVIEKHLAAGLDNCLAGTIDCLILAGDRALNPHGIRWATPAPGSMTSKNLIKLDKKC